MNDSANDSKQIVSQILQFPWSRKRSPGFEHECRDDAQNALRFFVRNWSSGDLKKLFGCGSEIGDKRLVGAWGIQIFSARGEVWEETVTRFSHVAMMKDPDFCWESRTGVIVSFAQISSVWIAVGTIMKALKRTVIGKSRMGVLNQFSFNVAFASSSSGLVCSSSAATHRREE